MNTEVICYLLRKTSLTRTEIGELSLAQLDAIAREVSYQERVEEYQRQYSVATLLAAIYNTIPRKNRRALQAKDFLNEDTLTRNGERRLDKIDQLAQEKGIILPSK